MTHPIPQIHGLTPQGLRSLETWIRRLPLPDEPDQWFYVLPLSPAAKPPDYRVHEPHPVFESPWQNNASANFATSFGRRKQGLHEKLYIRLAVTGGESLTDSLIFTLPENMRPLKKEPLLVRLGNTGIGAVDVNTDGTVVYVGTIVSNSDGGSLFLHYGTNERDDDIRIILDASRSFSLYEHTNAHRLLEVDENGNTNLDTRSQNLTVAGNDLDLNNVGDINISNAADLFVFLAGGGSAEIDLAVGNCQLSITDSKIENFLDTSKPFTVKDHSGNVILSVTDGVGAIKTMPPASSASALTLGSAFQNTLGYDILLNVVLNITVNTSGVVKLGVGPTSTPTQQTLATGVTTTGFLTVPIYLPDQYYALLSTTGTITLTIAGQNAMAV